MQGYALWEDKVKGRLQIIMFDDFYVVVDLLSFAFHDLRFCLSSQLKAASCAFNAVRIVNNGA